MIRNGLDGSEFRRVSSVAVNEYEPKRKDNRLFKQALG